VKDKSGYARHTGWSNKVSPYRIINKSYYIVLKR